MALAAPKLQFFNSSIFIDYDLAKGGAPFLPARFLMAKLGTKKEPGRFYSVRALFCPVFVPVFAFPPCFCGKSLFLRRVFTLFFVYLFLCVLLKRSLEALGYRQILVEAPPFHGSVVTVPQPHRLREALNIHTLQLSHRRKVHVVGNNLGYTLAERLVAFRYLRVTLLQRSVDAYPVTFQHHVDSHLLHRQLHLVVAQRRLHRYLAVQVSHHLVSDEKVNVSSTKSTNPGKEATKAGKQTTQSER